MFTSANRVGRLRDKALDLSLCVPEEIKTNYRRRIFWHTRSAKSVYGYNTVTTVFDKPCYRRWLEFKGEIVPDKVNYNFRQWLYDPPPILSKPERYWTLCKSNGEQIASYTNVIEAWYVLLGEQAFANRYCTLIYTDRTT